MYSSDVIQRNKQRAIYANFQALLNTQPTCVAESCIYGGCIVRYPTYEYRQDVAGGSLACGCGCPPTAAPTAVEPMFTMSLRVVEPVSFSIRTQYATDSLVVDWGDGSRDVYSTTADEQPGFKATVTHSYAIPGDYIISASSPTDAPLFRLDTSGLPINNKILSIEFTPIGKLLLTDIQLPNNQLSSIDISNCVNLAIIDLTNNLLTINAINTILVDLVNNGFNNGTASLDAQTPAAPPSGAGATAYTTLTTPPRSWTITVDP